LIRSVRKFVAGNRWVLLVVFGTILPLVALYAAGEWYKDRNYRERFVEIHGGLALAYATLEEEADGHLLYSLHLENADDIAVDGFLKVPAERGTRYPTLILLGGLRTGRRTIDYIRNTRGVNLLALDYPYQGKKEKLSVAEFVGAIPRIRDAIVRTPPAVMLAVDYLLTRDDVDPERIVLVGGSVGAIFTPAAAAADPRIAGAAMLFGAGDLESLMRANIDLPGVVAGPAGWLGAVLVSPVEPTKYVGQIAPRPVFMLNGTGDPRMPERCSRRLHEAAGEPRTVRWIDAGHVNIRDTEFHDLVSRELAAWLVANDLISPDNFVTGE